MSKLILDSIGSIERELAALRRLVNKGKWNAATRKGCRIENQAMQLTDRVRSRSYEDD